jgi:hypothetical protein
MPREGEVHMSKFEEYKLCDERVQRLSERRQAASQTYLSINTVIFSVFAFLTKDAGINGKNMAFISVPLCCVGILACIIWLKIISDFKKIIGWHYEQLRELEKDLPDQRPIYNMEWERFFKPGKRQDFLSFSRLEGYLPRMIIALYIIYFTIVLLAST